MICKRTFFFIYSWCYFSDRWLLYLRPSSKPGRSDRAASPFGFHQLREEQWLVLLAESPPEPFKAGNHATSSCFRSTSATSSAAVFLFFLEKKLLDVEGLKAVRDVVEEADERREVDGKPFVVRRRRRRVQDQEGLQTNWNDAAVRLLKPVFDKKLCSFT